MTKVLLGIGDFLEKWGNIALLVALVLVALGIFFLFFYRKSRWVGQAFLLHVPGVAALIQQIEISRFGYFFGTLLQSGIPNDFALTALRDLSSFVRYRAFYDYLDTSIEQGRSFQQLIVVGEQSGTLPTTLLRVHSDYEVKIESSAKDLTVILEPVLLIIVWLGLLAVALAVIMPIYNLIGQIDSI
jgi:type II secretory pathway component PulF